MFVSKDVGHDAYRSCEYIIYMPHARQNQRFLLVYFFLFRLFRFRPLKSPFVPLTTCYIPSCVFLMDPRLRPERTRNAIKMSTYMRAQRNSREGCDTRISLLFSVSKIYEWIKGILFVSCAAVKASERLWMMLQKHFFPPSFASHYCSSHVYLNANWRKGRLFIVPATTNKPKI